MSIPPLLIRGARLIDPLEGTDTIGDLLAVDGIIKARGRVSGTPDGVVVVEATGLCLAPGLVDLRAATREPGAEHKESIATLSEAAVAGGVTTLALLPETDPVIEDPALVQFLIDEGESVGLCRMLPYAALTQGLKGEQITEMGLLTQAGAAGFTDGHRPVASAAVMRRALAYAKAFGGVIFNHPEEPTLARLGMVTEGELATRLGLPAIPAVAETMMVERDLHLVRLTGGRYHAGPITTAGAVAAIRRAKDEGLAVTADTAIHYLTLTDAAVEDYRTYAKVSPPLRCEADRQAVIAAVADGTLDAISSDHQPHDRDSKRLPFPPAEAGVIGVETMLAVALELVRDGHMSLPRLISRMSAGPARILGLEVGTLAPGCPADLVLFDPDRPWRIDHKKLRSKSKNSAFGGRLVPGRAVRTYFEGRLVYDLLDLGR